MRKLFILLIIAAVMSAAACSSKTDLPKASVPSDAEKREISVSASERGGAEKAENQTDSDTKSGSVPESERNEPKSADSEAQEPQPASSAAESAAQEQQQLPAQPIPGEDDLSGSQPIAPWSYQKLLGKGMDVDWSKTNQGRKYYNQQAAADFAAAGVSHVRIRIADKATDELLAGLDNQIADCLQNGIIPVIAYQADDFKNDPSDKNLRKVVDWWSKVAERYSGCSYLLSFDLLIEATDALNKQPERLNELYEQLVTEIRKTNPDRMIIISPRLRSDPAYLNELEIPSGHNGYLMAEWHFYAAGPSKTNERKLWTTGTESERALIDQKIRLALDWQQQTGIPTWVGAWMPGNYNDGDDYTIEEQMVFADYMTRQLTNAGIPFAVNSDTKFYDREANEWIAETAPVFECIYN